MADDSSSPPLHHVPPPAAATAPTLDSLPVEVLNRVIASLVSEIEKPESWSQSAGRLACVNRSLRKSVSNLAVWKDEVRVIGRAGHVFDKGRWVFSGDDLKGIMRPRMAEDAHRIFVQEYVAKLKEKQPNVWIDDAYSKAHQAAHTKLHNPVIRQKYEAKAAAMQKRVATYNRATLLAGGFRVGGDLAAALRRLAASCTGPVHTLSLQFSLRDFGGGEGLPLSAVGPLLVSAWGPSLRFLNLGTAAIASPEELRALLAGCPQLVRLDMGGASLCGEAASAPGRLFSLVEPHAALRSVVLPPAPVAADAASPPPPTLKLAQSSLGCFVRDLCGRCPSLREIDANATVDATPPEGDDFAGDVEYLFCSPAWDAKPEAAKAKALQPYLRSFIVKKAAPLAALYGVRRFISESWLFLRGNYDSEGGDSSCDSVGIYEGEGNCLKYHRFRPDAPPAKPWEEDAAERRSAAAGAVALAADAEKVAQRLLQESLVDPEDLGDDDYVEEEYEEEAEEAAEEESEDDD